MTDQKQKPVLKVSIFDLDSCTVDDSGRKGLIDWANRDFSRYHSESAMVTDGPSPLGTFLLRRAIEAGHKIVFATARPQTISNITLNQIRDFFDLKVVEGEAILLMRNKNDEGTPSAIIKRKMFETLKGILSQGHPNHDFEFYAYDDHPSVVTAYREMGIKPWLVSKHKLIPGNETGIIDDLWRGEKPRIFGHVCQLESHHPYITTQMPDESYINDEINALFEASAFLTSSDDMPTDVYYEIDGFAHKKPELSMAEVLAEVEPVAAPEAVEEDDTLALIRSQAANGRIAADVLEEAARTFRERNAVYKDNANVVGKVMVALFPNGVKLETAEDFHMWHLFELLIVKLTRFTNSGLTHQDSILDLTVYGAMLEPLINSHTIKTK